MKKCRTFRNAKFLAISLLLAMVASCGNGNNEGANITGPGFIALDDTSSSFAPLLTVSYTSPTAGSATVQILSDPLSDGDVEFDPVQNTYTTTVAPSKDFFGEDSANPDLPEFRAFHTFPLDGATGQPVVPGDATINSAVLEVFVDNVDFASVIPTFVDMIQYPFRGLSAADFDAPLITPTSYRALDFFFSDEGNFVDIDVTALMQQAQVSALTDFQVRYDLQSLASGASKSASLATSRNVHAPPRPTGNLMPRQNAGADRPRSR